MFVIVALTTEEKQSKNSQIDRLINKIAQGNVSAMGELYDVIKTDVFSYALSKTGNKIDAEDITQDTFVQIYKYAKQYQSKGKPMAWIITIELNLIRRHYKLKSRTVNLDESFENMSDNSNFERGIINNAFLTHLLRTLSEEEREIIALHVVSGFKHREIANLLNKPLSTVLSKYNRAIKKLQLIVKEEK